MEKRTRTKRGTKVTGVQVQHCYVKIQRLELENAVNDEKESENHNAKNEVDSGVKTRSSRANNADQNKAKKRQIDTIDHIDIETVNGNDEDDEIENNPGDEGDEELDYQQKVKKAREDNLKLIESLFGKKPERQPRKYREKEKLPPRHSFRLEELRKPRQFIEPPHEEPPPLRLESKLSFKSVSLQDEKMPTDNLCLDNIPKKPKSRPLSWYEEILPSMNSKLLVNAVVTSNIYAMSIHPSVEVTLIAAGDYYGEIGFWSLPNKHSNQHGDYPLIGNVYNYRPHMNRITCLEFHPTDLYEIYSSSIDGTFRRGDLQNAVFEELYRPPDDGEQKCSYFDFISPSVFLLGFVHGAVAVIDKRTRGQHGDMFNLDIKGLMSTVNVHPLKREYFITADNSGKCHLWDLRHIKNRPIHSLEHPKTCHSTFFSPITGNSILTTSKNEITIYDSEKLNGDMRLKHCESHNNCSSHLKSFRATWLPSNDDCFVVGSTAYPRRIEVFRDNGKLIYEMQHEDLQFITSGNAWHPTKAMMACASNSGKIFLFGD